MVIIYLIIVKAYGLLIWIASVFNTKALKWRKGRVRLFNQIEKALQNDGQKRIWFHCSSLGEFEQGKPVIESVKKDFPSYKIVLTFFSPSGYEIKKNDPLADYVFYLPLDGPFSSKRFINLVKPHAVFFVKYEYWHFYIYYLRQLKIPLYYFSCIFRPSQPFFQFYGRFYKNMLQRITHIFVQNQESLVILYKHSIPHVTVSGDTRFDRVYANSLNTKKYPEIEKFINGSKVMIAGSIWSSDEQLLIPLINQSTGYRFIIAPHEINTLKIQQLVALLKKKCIRYSDLKMGYIGDADVLIIDNIGMLSSLYQYANISYIGGGFGAGIHNILEAAVFGNALIFGPKYQKFREAVELIELKGAYSVNNYNQLKECFDLLNTDEQFFNRVCETNKKYVESKKGATEIIMNYLHMNW